MILSLFSAADLRAELNSSTLDALARQGTHGVEVIVVASLAVIVCATLIFLFRFYREARKYDILRDDSIKELTQTVHRYTATANAGIEKIAGSLSRMELNFDQGIEKIHTKIVKQGVMIDHHEKRLDAVDEKLDAHDAILNPVEQVPTPPARPKRRKSPVRAGPE